MGRTRTPSRPGDSRGDVELLPAARAAGSGQLAESGLTSLPAIIAGAGRKAAEAFVEYFCVTIENRNTRLAYARQVWAFLDWCDDRGLSLQNIRPLVVASYIQSHSGSDPSRKQALAAIRKCFDYLVVNHVLHDNPATSVKGPSYRQKKGKTSILDQEQAHELLESIDTSTIAGLRNRALIATMYFSFGRVGAVVNMTVEDYFQSGKKWWFRLHEKGGNLHDVPAHHKAQEYMDEYLEASSLSTAKHPLFPTLTRRGNLSDRPMSRRDVLRMVKRQATVAGLPPGTCCHTFRATGITEYMKAGGSVEGAQRIANHADARTTKLYDHSGDDVTLDEIERIPSI